MLEILLFTEVVALLAKLDTILRYSMGYESIIL